MEASELVLRIAFLALPGLVGSKLYRKLRGRGTERKTWQDFTEVLLFALMSYVLLAAVLAIFTSRSSTTSTRINAVDPISIDIKSIEEPGEDTFWDRLSIIDAVFSSEMRINISEIFLASGIGMLLGMFASYIHKRNLAMRFFQRIRVTKRFGDEDVWDFFLGSPDTDGWLFVRDHKADVIYYGAITQYSETKQDRELVIENVSVHSTDGQKMYECRALYVARARDALTIELPDFEKLKTKQEINTRDPKIA